MSRFMVLVNEFRLNCRVGFFLALRQIRRSSIWTTGLIIFIMSLTFLNLVVVSGILVGLIEGSSIAYRAQYSADVLISTLDSKSTIEKTPEIVRALSTTPGVEDFVVRYIQGVTLEANYRSRARTNEKPDEVGVSLVGINPTQENRVTGLADRVITGSYLSDADEGKILIGNYLLDQYAVGGDRGFGSLSNVDAGSKVRIKFGDSIQEVTVKGVVSSKVSAVSIRAFMNQPDLIKFVGRTDRNADEIAIRLKPGWTPQQVQASLVAQGFGEYAKIQTWKETQGQFFDQIATTFGLLGNAIGSISLVVASITVFIVIFINAITRKRYIGILKGIGIQGMAIEISYVLQSLFFAFVGTCIGLVVLYGFLQPFIDRNPINFPFSDGILVAPWSGTMVRVALLMGATCIAGYIPARLVIRKNTLDSILGR